MSPIFSVPAVVGTTAARRIIAVLGPKLRWEISADVPRQQGSWPYLHRALVTRIYDISRSVCRLTEEGLQADANLLTRSALNHLFVLAWLAVDGRERSLQLVQYEERIRTENEAMEQSVASSGQLSPIHGCALGDDPPMSEKGKPWNDFGAVSEELDQIWLARLLVLEAFDALQGKGEASTKALFTQLYAGPYRETALLVWPTAYALTPLSHQMHNIDTGVVTYEVLPEGQVQVNQATAVGVLGATLWLATILSEYVNEGKVPWDQRRLNAVAFGRDIAPELSRRLDEGRATALPQGYRQRLYESDALDQAVEDVRKGAPEVLWAPQHRLAREIVAEFDDYFPMFIPDGATEGWAVAAPALLVRVRDIVVSAITLADAFAEQ